MTRELNPIDTIVFTMAVVGDNLYVGGSFTSAGGRAALNIARWDGEEWSALGSGIGLVRALAVQGNDLIAGGTFNTAGGLTVTNIARWDGTNWHSLGGGLPGDAVDAVAASEDAVYAGGRITGFYENGEPTYLAKWDGRQWSTMGIRATGVERLLWTTRGLLAGGGFFIAGGESAQQIALWDGGQWSSLHSGLPTGYYPRCFAEARETLYAAAAGDLGSGLWTGSVMAWDGARWNGLGGPFERPGTGGGVVALASNGAELVAGGLFSVAGGKPCTNIAVWQIPRTLKHTRSTDQLALSWPGPETNAVLEATEHVSTAAWEPVTTTPVVVNGRLTVTNTVAQGNRFYRLRSQ